MLKQTPYPYKAHITESDFSMTILEFLKLLRLHLKSTIIIPIICAVICFASMAFISSAHPSYTATSTVVTTGGSFASVAGLAESEASKVFDNGATVEASTSTTQNKVTFTAKGTSSEFAINAANSAAANLSELANQNANVTSATVNEAKTASNSNKNPLLYALVGFLGGLFCVVVYHVLRDTVRGNIHTPEAVSACGLTYLGALSTNKARMRIVVANFHFSNKDKNSVAKNILLHPTNSKVHIDDAYDMLSEIATEAEMDLSIAPAFEESVYTLYEGRDADTVIVVVEENVTTIAEIDEIVREFKIANINAGGFVYLPYKKKKEKKA